MSYFLVNHNKRQSENPTIHTLRTCLAKSQQASSTNKPTLLKRGRGVSIKGSTSRPTRDRLTECFNDQSKRLIDRTRNSPAGRCSVRRHSRKCQRADPREFCRRHSIKSEQQQCKTRGVRHARADPLPSPDEIRAANKGSLTTCGGSHERTCRKGGRTADISCS